VINLELGDLAQVIPIDIERTYRELTAILSCS
jgi:hypothetical protein